MLSIEQYFFPVYKGGWIGNNISAGSVHEEGRMSWRGMMSSKSMPGCFVTTCWSRIGQAVDWQLNLSFRGLTLFILTVNHKSDYFKCATIAILKPYNLTQNFQYGTFPKSFRRIKNKYFNIFISADIYQCDVQF